MVIRLSQFFFRQAVERVTLIQFCWTIDYRMDHSRLKGALVALKTYDCVIRGRVVDVSVSDEPGLDVLDEPIETIEHVWLDDVEELDENKVNVSEDSVEHLLSQNGVAISGLQQFHATEIVEFQCLDASLFRREKGWFGWSFSVYLKLLGRI